jgi:hypothetical protein
MTINQQWAFEVVHEFVYSLQVMPYEDEDEEEDNEEKR